MTTQFGKNPFEGGNVLKRNMTKIQHLLTAVFIPLVTPSLIFYKKETITLYMSLKDNAIISP